MVATLDSSIRLLSVQNEWSVTVICSYSHSYSHTVTSRGARVPSPPPPPASWILTLNFFFGSVLSLLLAFLRQENGDGVSLLELFMPLLSALMPFAGSSP